MAMGQKGNIEEKRPMSGFFRPMLLDFTICTAISGNGVRTIGMTIIIVRRLMEVLGYLGEILAIGCCVVVAGTTFRGTAVLRFEATIVPAFGTTILGFVLWSPCRELNFSLLFFPLSLFPHSQRERSPIFRISPLLLGEYL